MATDSSLTPPCKGGGIPLQLLREELCFLNGNVTRVMDSPKSLSSLNLANVRHQLCLCMQYKATRK